MNELKDSVNFDVFLKNFKKHLNSLKLKNSIQKDYVLKVLYLSNEHLNAQEIAQRISDEYKIDISITTVYKALKFFEDIDIVRCLDIGGKAKKYEFSLTLHHDHLICTNCNKIVEFSDLLLESTQERIAEKNSFKLQDHIMTIYGLCEECQ